MLKSRAMSEIFLISQLIVDRLTVTAGNHKARPFEQAQMLRDVLHRTAYPLSNIIYR